MFRPLSETKFINDANLVSYWKLDGNSNDSKSSNNGTDTNITYGTNYAVQSNFGQGASFNGTSSKIDLGNAIVPSTEITLSCWVYIISPFNNYRGIISKKYNTSDTYSYLIQQTDTAKILQLVWTLNGSNSYINSSAIVENNKWYHIVSTIKTGDSAKIYINGKLDTSTSIPSGNILYNSSYNTTLGTRSLSDYFNGYIDDVAIFNRALSSAEVNELYQSYTLGEYIPNSNTKLLLHLNGNSTDSSGNNNNGTDTSITYGLGYGRFGQGATFTSSATSNIHGTNSITYSAITYSLWVKLNAQPENGKWFFFIDNTGTIDGGVAYLNNSGQYRLYNYPNWEEYQIPTNTWINIIATNDGSYFKMYINGKQIMNQSGSRVGASTGYYIGNYHNLGSNYVTNGSIDEIIIENRAWTAAEIAKYYTMTKGRFGIL